MYQPVKRRTKMPIISKSSELPRNMSLRTLLATGGLGLLAACSGGMGNFDWDMRSGASSTSASARQATAARPAPDANGVLSYPGYQMVEARRGDTVTSVAQRLGISPEELAQANALKSTDHLRRGELLLLPNRISAMPQPVSPAMGAPVDITAVAGTALDRVETTPLPPISASAPGGGKEPIRHTVTRGETAFTIARTYGVSAKSLAEWNSLGPDMHIREGQTLMIPVATAPAPTLEPRPTAPGAGSPTPEPPSASAPLPAEKVAPAAEKPKEIPASPDMSKERTIASSSRLAMPVNGSVTRGYDKKKNQGIDIAAPAGTAVKAADAGTVAAVTKDTEQMQIVVLRHADGLLTVYAGIGDLKVAKGDRVNRGQTIGTVAGGKSSLHFEVREGVESRDPMPYLQ